MNTYIFLLLGVLGYFLAEKIRSGEPWILRFSWLFTISLLAFGITSGTKSDLYQWIVGSTQGAFISILVCEIRLFLIKRGSPSGK